MKAFIGLLLISLFAGIEMRSLSSSLCPNGLPQVNCFVDPCNVIFTKVCPGHPNARCLANYCGGCNAEWYDMGRKVSC